VAICIELLERTGPLVVKKTSFAIETKGDIQTFEVAGCRRAVDDAPSPPEAAISDFSGRVNHVECGKLDALLRSS